MFRNMQGGCGIEVRVWLHGKYYDIRLISVLESMDNGKSIRETRDCDIPIVARHFYHHSGITLFPNSAHSQCCHDYRVGSAHG